MNLTEKELIESFTDFINENYYVDQLTEENVLWIYEEEFIPSLKESLNEEIIKLQEKMNIIDIFGGAAAGAATAAVIGFNPFIGAALGAFSGATANYPDPKKADAKKVQVASVPKNKTSTNTPNTPKTTTEEKETSPKMQAYLDKMSKKGTKSIEHGGDGATTKRDVIIARLQAKKKNSGLSMKEEDLLAKLIAAEEKEDSGKKK